MEPHSVVFLVQVHSVRQHFLNVTDLNRHLGRQETAVNFDASRIDVVKRPYPKVLYQVMHVAACAPMQRFVLVYRNYGHVQQVGLAHDVPLESNKVRQTRVPVVVNFFTGYSDLFLSFRMANIPRSEVAVF